MLEKAVKDSNAPGAASADRQPDSEWVNKAPDGDGHAAMSNAEVPSTTDSKGARPSEWTAGNAYKMQPDSLTAKAPKWPKK